MSDKNTPCLVAVDDGYAQIKLYGQKPDGSVIANVNRSSVRSGRYGVGSISGDGFLGLYETESGPFTVSEEIESENTQFNGFHTSPMNRVLVHHALVTAGDGAFCGHKIKLITGLPVADFFSDGFKDDEKIAAKKANLLQEVRLATPGAVPAIDDVVVGCQAVAAWFDYALDDNLDVRNEIEGDVAIIDIGGRTTDIATVIGGNSVDHKRSGTANIGVLDVYKDVAKSINARFKLKDDLPIKVLDKAVRTGTVRMWREDHNVSDLVEATIAEYQDKIAREIERKIGSGATMTSLVFVGGGSALFSKIAQEFKNGILLDDPEFSNARGLYKFARYKEQEA